MMSPRRSLNLKGKKHENVFFATQNNLKFELELKHSKCQFFCFVKWTVQYKQSTFEFLEVIIKQKFASF